MSEEGQTEISKQPLEVGVVPETRAISENLDSGELGNFVKRTLFSPYMYNNIVSESKNHHPSILYIHCPSDKTGAQAIPNNIMHYYYTNPENIIISSL